MDLSKAEYRVVVELAKGNAQKEIADHLCLSQDTVRNHLANVRKKNSLRNGIDVVREFILSIDNPKQLFIAVVFMVIQSHIVFQLPDMELRKTARTSLRVKTSKKRNDEF